MGDGADQRRLRIIPPGPADACALRGAALATIGADDQIGSQLPAIRKRQGRAPIGDALRHDARVVPMIDAGVASSLSSIARRR